MKVLIVGSRRHLKPATESALRREFEQACEQLGRRLAEHGHTVIVGTDDPEDADPYVVQGVLAAAKPGTIWVARPDEDTRATPFAAVRETLPAGLKIDDAPRRSGDWTPALAHSLAEADLLLLLGGRATAQTAGYLARVLKRPVLALPQFGGAAKVLWPEVRRYYPASGIRDNDIGALERTWDATIAAIAVGAGEALVRRSPFRPRSFGLELVLLLVTLVLLAAWALLFNRSHHDQLLFAMMVLSALLGTLLRTIWMSREGGPINGRILVCDLTASVIVGFGCALFYYVGGFLLTSEKPSPTDVDALTRAAVFMSIVGVAAGFRIEQMIPKLQQMLDEKTNPSGPANS